MNKLKTVDSKVLSILRECPETRFDDMKLILAITTDTAICGWASCRLKILSTTTKATACRVLRLSAEQGREYNPCFPNCRDNARAVAAMLRTS